MPLKVHAKVKIKIAGTIALKPSVRLSINARAEMTLRGIYNRKMTIKVKKEPSAKESPAEQSAKASFTLAPSKMPPV